MIVSRACKYPDPDLRLCLEFEDGVLDPVHDSSRYLLDLPATDLTQRSRGSSPAAGFGLSSDLRVPETTGLDIGSRLTIEMWVAPTSSQSVPLLVNDQQYAMSIDSNGRIACQLAFASARSITTAQNDSWTHVACTYSGTVLRVYVDGVQSDCDYGADHIGTGGTSGSLIAPNFVGGVDAVRIYARTLSPDEICMHADKSPCAAPISCPD